MRMSGGAWEGLAVGGASGLLPTWLVHFACIVAMLCRVAPPLVLQALNAMCFEPDHPPDG